MSHLIFDGHNDALGRLWGAGGDPVADFAKPIGHVNVPAARSGGLGGGFFALFSPTKRAPFDFSVFEAGNCDFPLPPALDEGVALQSALAQAGIAHRLQAAGYLRICTDPLTLAQSFMGSRLACVLHLEGADCIDEDFLALDALYALGLRSLGLVWSRPTKFAEGVPFQGGRDGDTGAGLTALGKRLVDRCVDLGLIVDTSHLTMKGFWDVAEAGLPLVATHSNAYSLCRATRNLTDTQLKAIGETGGMVGLNFGSLFLSEAGWSTGKATIKDCLLQLDHMIEVAGEDHVGLGSDFDGAPLPQGITSAADLDVLRTGMADHGYSDDLIAKICNENWLGFVSDSLARSKG